jgi:hypothetical protein
MQKLTVAALVLTLTPAVLGADQSASAPKQPTRATHVMEPSGGGIKWLIVSMIAAQAADIATTSLALQRGCVETTYYGLQNKWAIGGMKSSGAIVLGVTLPFAHTKKPKLTKALAWAQLGSGVIGAAFNTARLPGCR